MFTRVERASKLQQSVDSVLVELGSETGSAALA